MRFAILRLRKRQLASASAMARHALRDGGHRVTNADPARRGENTVLVGPGTAAEAVQALRQGLPERRRKDAIEAVELLVSASPEALAGMPRQKQDAYFADALRFIAERFGGPANVKLAVVHRDESTPHMQVLLTPLVDGRLVANKLIGGPAGLRKLQTDFASQVGARHGLVRGLETKPGEERPAYQTVRRWYTAIAGAGSVEALPKLKPVPPVPAPKEAPGVFSGRAAREAWAAAEKARQAAGKARQMAIEHNKRTMAELSRLAGLGLSVYGKAARTVGERLAAGRDAAERVGLAAATVEKQRQEFNDRAGELARLDKQIDARRRVLGLGELEAERELLRAQVDELRERRTHRPRGG